MKLKNYMEDAARIVLDEMLEKRRPDVCKCARCRLDILAYALNHLPAKYVVTDKGHTFTRVAEMQQQFGTDMVVVLSKAMKHICKNPRHEIAGNKHACS